MRFLRFRPRDRRQRDAFAEIPVTLPAAPRFEYPHFIAGQAAEALDAALLAYPGPAPADPEPAPPAVSIADDYRDLRVFPAVVRGACRAGLTGLGTRGVHPVPPLPDYGLHRFTADFGPDTIGEEFDQVAERADAGFYSARRVFHRADTAGFPAVVA